MKQNHNKNVLSMNLIDFQFEVNQCNWSFGYWLVCWFSVQNISNSIEFGFKILPLVYFVCGVIVWNKFRFFSSPVQHWSDLLHFLAVVWRLLFFFCFETEKLAPKPYELLCRKPIFHYYVEFSIWVFEIVVIVCAKNNFSLWVFAIKVFPEKTTTQTIKVFVDGNFYYAQYRCSFSFYNIFCFLMVGLTNTVQSVFDMYFRLHNKNLKFYSISNDSTK